MNITLDTDTVADVVRRDYRTARVFKKHHIDFCCGGGKTLAQACVERKLSEEALLQALSEALRTESKDGPDFDQWALDDLADHIEIRHHRYVEETVPLLWQYLKKLVAVHSQGAPYLVELASYFKESSGNLAQHMKKEELVLFPYIRKMVKTKTFGDPLPEPHFGSVENPINAMLMEHEQEGENFRKMEAVSNGFDIPEWACNTFAVTMQLLQEFQDDLHLHIHLENNILFPKAAAMERELRASGPTPLSSCSLKLPNTP